MVSVYLRKCEIWSDGEEDHKESHNHYYDVKFFILEETPNYVCIFSWCGYKSNEFHGLITLWEDEIHLMELKSRHHVDAFTKEKCKRLVEMDMDRLQNRLNLCGSDEKHFKV